MEHFNSVFDQLAESYTSSTPPPPEEYIQLIQRSFDLGENDMVIDLGCGSGALSLALSRFSSNVQGVDSSTEMIRIARSRDVQRRVRWTCGSVESLDLGHKIYKLIISFEAFHLFPEPDSLVRRCALGLKTSGYLCIGWANFEWEEPLRDIIIRAFDPHNITWEDWGYQCCPSFAALVERNGIGLSSVVQKTININSSTHVRDIATYLVSIGKTASLGTEEKKHLSQELESKFRVVFSSEWSSGPASYSLAYCRKL